MRISIRRGLSIALASIALGLAGEAFAKPSAPIVEVTSDPGGASGVVKGQVDIAATPATVWAVIVDPANTGKLIGPELSRTSFPDCRT